MTVVTITMLRKALLIQTNTIYCTLLGRGGSGCESPLLSHNIVPQRFGYDPRIEMSG